jgi:hypothetical protein
MLRRAIGQTAAPYEASVTTTSLISPRELEIRADDRRRCCRESRGAVMGCQSPEGRLRAGRRLNGAVRSVRWGLHSRQYLKGAEIHGAGGV